MAFATLEQIKPFVINGLHSKLSDEATTGVTWFDVISAEVDKYIRDKTGIALGTTLDWIIFPYALLVKKFASHLLEGVTPDYAETIDKDFEQANKLLLMHPQTDDLGNPTTADASTSYSGAADNMLEF